MTAHEAQCLICTSGVTVDLSRPNAEIARTIGVSKDSVRRHKAAVKTDNDPFFTDVPTAIITSRGRTVRLEDGSYQKVTYQPAKMALLESLSYDDIERAIADYNESPALYAGNPHTSTAHAADLQIGKAQQRGGGTPETIRRVRQSFAALAERYRESQPEHIILSDNGDPIENIFNVASQSHTNDMDVSLQIRTFRRLMIEGIKMLAPLAPRFTYLAVPSNHGAVRSGFKNQAGTTDADFGLDISYQLEDVFAEHPTLKHVEFVRPDLLEETAEVYTSGTKLAYHHGHQASGPDGQGKWWANQDHGRRPGWDADVLVTAHFHSLRVGHSGDGRWIIGVSSSDPGSDWFTNKTGEAARQGMTTFDVRDGQWSNLAIV